MLSLRQNALRSEVEQLVQRHGRGHGALLPILQDLKREQGGIDDLSMQEIADRLGIQPVEVYGVVSFYAFLQAGRPGRFVIRLCRSLSCDLAGKGAVARQLMTDLGIGFGQTTPDGSVTLEWANCIGMCDQGPALLVNEQVHVRVTPGRVHDIVSTCIGSPGVSGVEPGSTGER